MTLSLFHRFYSSTYSIAPAAHFSFTSPSCPLSRSLSCIQAIFFLPVGLSLAASSRNLSVQIQLPSLPETHIHHWRGNKLFQDRQTVLFGSPLFVFFFPLSPSLSHQQMGYFNEISLACSHLCEKWISPFLNEGIYNQTGWYAGNPCTKYFCFCLQLSSILVPIVSSLHLSQCVQLSALHLMFLTLDP